MAIGFLIALAMVFSVKPARANTPIYQITPLLPTINLGGDEPLQLTVQHLSPTRSYTFLVNVTTPSHYQSVALVNIMTNDTGDGNATLHYPTDFFAYPKPPTTNATGVYTIVLYGVSGSIRALSSFQANSKLILNRLQAIDSNGSAVNEVSAGGVIYFDFAAKYLNGTPVTSGQAAVQINDGLPSSTFLPASYSEPKGLFITIHGYQVPKNSSQVTLSVSAIVIDQAGNQGTSPTASFPLTLAPRNLLFAELLAPLALLAGGSGASFYTLRHTKRSLPLKQIRKAILQSGKRSVLITGRKRKGITALLQGFLKEDLKSGVPSTYLTFENPPERLIPQLFKSGIDVLQGLETGTLMILDCSDLNTSLDLTILRLRLASALAKIRPGKFALYIDSLTLLFEDLPTDQVLGFLTELNVEVIRARGVVYATARSTKVTRKNLSAVREVFDGIFEITPTGAGSDESKLELKGVNEEMKRMPIGELKVAPDSTLQVEVPLTSNLEKKITES